MLESKKIELRRSELRQELAALAAKAEPTEDEVRSMEAGDKEYRQLETRYRAALVAEDEERREAGKDLETRSDNEWADLLGRFEVRQVAMALDHGHQIDGETAEIVQELRSQGTYQGVPVPWQALEQRAGETIASGTPDPVQTRPIIDRLFPQSVAGRMGGAMINVGQGELEFPVATSSVSAGWQTSETGNVAGPTAYATIDRPLAPDHTLGITMKLTRKTLKQAGAALEQAVRRDMNGCIAQELDRVVFLGGGSSGEPDGVVAGASGYSITETDVSAYASWAEFRRAIVRFMAGSAASSPSDVRLLVRPEVYNQLDNGPVFTGASETDWDKMMRQLKSITVSPNALEAPSGSPEESKALLTTVAGGVPPFWVATWGAVDMIRDPYSDAASGGLRVTGLCTMDTTVSRPAQLEVLTGLQ
ncbi:phage major capsid protein [Roseovarius sp.]|uniref:phage major capsid protein n=1 Tax=Roseovarius sp. TaxID=1486281 RepID=UPI003BA88BC5